jgi:hypothetical protein
MLHRADFAEQSRNLSTPACLSAMNETIPPPPKPEYRQAHSIQHRLVRHLVPFINASYALETQMMTSDNYCGAENLGHLFTTMINCSLTAAPSVSERSSSDRKRLFVVSRFPLPSIKDATYLNKLSARWPLAYLWLSLYIYYQSILILTQAAILILQPNHKILNLYRRLHLPTWIINLLSCGMTFAHHTLMLSRAMAKDLYIQSCLSFQVITPSSSYIRQEN